MIFGFGYLIVFQSPGFLQKAKTGISGILATQREVQAQYPNAQIGVGYDISNDGTGNSLKHILVSINTKEEVTEEQMQQTGVMVCDALEERSIPADLVSVAATRPFNFFSVIFSDDKDTSEIFQGAKSMSCEEWRATTLQ